MWHKGFAPVTAPQPHPYPRAFSALFPLILPHKPHAS